MVKNPFAKRLKNLSPRDYSAYCMHIRNSPSNNTWEELKLYSGKLFQEVCLTNYSKIEHNRLGYLRYNQEKLRTDLYNNAVDSLANDIDLSDIGQNHTLPGTYSGSIRVISTRYQNAMPLAAKYGAPDLFITMTSNPQWPEIVQKLEDGQTAADRPDITRRVFHSKMKDKLHTFLFWQMHCMPPPFRGL